MAQQRQDRRGEVQAATASATGLACFIFRFLRRPPYEAWQQENHPDIQQQMQRREEVNINVHRERGEDVEPGDDF
ncbi:hypothetical protein [Escherichia coli]|uniref:hypothetical protein n=1 Tax=Escherichia coli TaxID=562 RepID=UPI0005CF9C61|nr:hypothetical protein [Escherichia coli]